MSLPANAKDMRLLFVNNGYTYADDLYDTRNISKKESIDFCYIIARKENFVIIYVEAKSNWRSIATELITKNNDMCLVVTHVAGNHYVFSTPIYEDGKQRPAHVVINDSTQQNILSKFIAKMRLKQEDTDVGTTLKMKKTFAEFNTYQQAIDGFAENLEEVISDTRNAIETSGKANPEYDKAKQEFLEMCKTVISEQITSKDVTEMLIQHILTFRIFALVYDEHEFHKTNAVARNLNHLVELLGITASSMNVNYTTIELVAESITENKDRQELLKKIYEIFYEKYNKDAADTQGIVYTPFEVVDFMIESTDILLKRHFDSSISDRNVKILDPATGTGTFVSHLLEYIDKESLESKYKNDIFADDISILAYYIAALNIENTYKKRTGKSKEFENICWMDTLDAGVKDLSKMDAWFGNYDNIKRITKQRNTMISVIIGNPPYNAVQVSFNDNNAAREYTVVDERIEETYVKHSSVQGKIKQYDMYKRFLRWSTDRIGSSGIVAFISNNSFLDAKTDDGFRKVVVNEFDHIYSVNLKGNQNIASWRKECGKLFGSKAKIGISISFFIKTGKKKKDDLGKIYYSEIDDYKTREEKLQWLKDNSLDTLREREREIVPDKNHIWLNQTNNDFEELIPIISDDRKSIFNELSTGYLTSRDDWVHDFNINELKEKMRYFINFYNSIIEKYETNIIKIERIDAKLTIKNVKSNESESECYKIKQSIDLMKNIKRKLRIKFQPQKIKKSLYRPFCEKNQYYDKTITERIGKFDQIFTYTKDNLLIGFSNPKPNRPFRSLGSNKMIEYGCIGDTQCIPLKFNNKSNITKFVLDTFKKHYEKEKITDESIFYYTYAMLNDPKYEEKYRFDLQRSLPRIPLAQNFEIWKKIGYELFLFHAEFNEQKEYPLKTIIKKSKHNKVKLQLKQSDASKDDYKILIDENTTLEGIPAKAIQYKLGSKCALGWILEFYKKNKNQISEKSSNDPKIRERFNTYNFADHKEHVISLLKKVTTVSVKTMELREKLEKMEWGPQPDLGFKTEDKAKPITEKSKITKIKKKKTTDKIQKLDSVL